ncbi:ABC transporter substrate-binding protein [Halobacillus campisalis]|uniref:ABC transporter substrate-binding protein n=1 Tax=Halobacillus campisalis TaxID=435909 RepID=A0ABW2K6E3_9BACI|nr:iron-siderophore ABC transporter substrate-binding protein [Halobacillus campisalis]
MKNVTIYLIAGILLLLAACSDSEESSTTDQEDEQEKRSVTIEDGMGEKTIEGTPEDVVVLEWSYVEHVLPLGIEPVGVADVDGYNKWINVGDPLPDSTEDVGTRAEPNLEAIARLEPDLIIGAKYNHEGIAEELEEIAPTVMFSPYSEEDADDQYEHLLNEFDTAAEIFDKQEEAEQTKQQLDDTFSEQSERLDEAGLDTIEAVVTQAFTAQDSTIMRHFTDNSVVAGVLEEIGVDNAVETEEPEIYGFLETDIEALQNYQDARFFYLVLEEDNVFEQLEDNPAWTNLDFVEEGHTYELPGDMGTFAGPLSAERLAVELTDALIENE